MIRLDFKPIKPSEFYSDFTAVLLHTESGSITVLNEDASKIQYYELGYLQDYYFISQSINRTSIDEFTSIFNDLENHLGDLTESIGAWYDGEKIPENCIEYVLLNRISHCMAEFKKAITYYKNNNHDKEESKTGDQN